MKRAAVIALALILIMPSVLAQDHYADLKIDVDKNDFVSIQGDTDYESILTEGTEQYISKENGVRTLKIETPDEFSEYYITLNLPSGAAINYIKSSGTFRIESTLGKMSVITFAEDKPISITVQYTIQKTSTTIIYCLALLVIILGTLIALMPRLLKRIKPKAEKPNLKGLTHRQKQIMELLMAKSKPLTQTEIEEELKLPKSSVSRNIRTLEMKGLIEKEKTGMSNKICIKQH